MPNYIYQYSVIIDGKECIVERAIQNTVNAAETDKAVGNGLYRELLKVHPNSTILVRLLKKELY